MSTPFKRDIIRELVDACRRHGIRIQFYYSLLDWHHPHYVPAPSGFKTHLDTSATSTNTLTTCSVKFGSCAKSIALTVFGLTGLGASTSRVASGGTVEDDLEHLAQRCHQQPNRFAR